MTADRRSGEIGLGKQLALLISSEITVKVLVILVERVASPSEIAAELREKTPAISHHVKKLVRMNLVELIDEREVGGAVQHFYRAVVRPIVSNEEWEKLPLEEKQRFSVWIVQMVVADAAHSFQAATFDRHPKNHLSRTPMVVDKKGLVEVAEIQDRALSEILQVEANSSERLANAGGTGMNLISSMMCFEIPEPTRGLDTGRKWRFRDAPAVPAPPLGTNLHSGTIGGSDAPGEPARHPELSHREARHRLAQHG